MANQAITEDGDEVVAPLTADERRALARVEAAQLAKDAATSGKGNGPSVLDQYRASQRPAFLPGAKIQTGPIASVGYEPNLSLDPRNVDALLPKNTKGEPDHADVLALTRAAFDGSFKSLDHVAKARVAANADPTRTEAAAFLSVGTLAEKHLERMTQSFDKARKNLDDFVSALDKSLSAPLEGGTRDPLAVEIREYVSKLPESKRAEFVGEALKKNDVKTLQAVLGAPAFLSGLGDAHHQLYTRRYREMSNPVAVARLDVARKGLELLDARAGLVFGEIERAAGGSFAKLKKIREARDASEAALVMQSGLE